MNPPPALISGLVVFAAVGCGLIGGLLFAFSNFVMRALAQQPAEHGIRTMQTINRDILNPLFLFVFMGTALVSAALAAAAAWGKTALLSTPLLLTACLLCLAGVFGVTAGLNIPLNNRLAAHDPASAAAAQFWPLYISEWVKWNHVRTFCSLAASVFFILARR
ncbi:MAG: DUF1772 domain-containing protein [Verrucomicrobiaceae bacterium]|nr:MAG: DUF1772 domain-containing protein [Verrucomicrobiaceae bacterium]